MITTARTPPFATVLAVVVTVLAAATVVAQESQPEVPLRWGGWVSEVPLRDLSGEWRFDAARSDLMIEEWRGRPIQYSILQHPDRIELEFRPDDAVPTRRVYAWNGSVVHTQRGGREVRLRAGWQQGGRVLVIEGRHWTLADQTVSEFEMRYEIAPGGRLALTQVDGYGETVWYFERVR